MKQMLKLVKIILVGSNVRYVC